MKCKNCGHNVADPPPKVVEKIIQVDQSDGHYWVRVALIVGVVFVVMILAVAGTNMIDSYRDMKVFGEPSIKVEITEFDNAGRSTKKLSR